MRTIEVVPYNPAWPAMFEQLSTPLRNHLKDLIIDVHHVGSTSVHGLAAKPVIDIDIEIADTADFNAVVDALAVFGYTHVGNQGIAGREAFKRDIPLSIPHHLYVCQSSAVELNKHLAFRDYLRKHAEARDAYAAIKREAASRYPHDIEGYLKHKGRFIRSIYTKCGFDD